MKRRTVIRSAAVAARMALPITRRRAAAGVQPGTGESSKERPDITLIYGAVSSVSANPIEKKPFYHFHPGTHALTAGSWGCNFGCPWCRNREISKNPPPVTGPFTSPTAFVDEGIRLDCRGTSISFSEPTLSLE